MHVCRAGVAGAAGSGGPAASSPSLPIQLRRPRRPQGGKKATEAVAAQPPKNPARACARAQSPGGHTDGCGRTAAAMDKDEVCGAWQRHVNIFKSNRKGAG